MVLIPTGLTLKSSRCAYRYPVLEDQDWILKAICNPRFPRGLPLGQLQTGEQVVNWIKNCQRRWGEGTSYTWTIEKIAADQPVGQVTLGQMDSPSTWALAFWIEPDSWGSGLATEAAWRLVQYGFQEMGAEKIWAGVALWNQASRRVLEKIGLVYVKNNPAGYQIDGKPVETMEYEVDREKWSVRDGAQE